MKQVCSINKQRRSKERYVYQVNYLVQQWRDLFDNGYMNRAGIFTKPSLQEAANMVGCSKKTLEYYQGILRKAKSLTIIEECFLMKIGRLKELIKKTKVKCLKAPKQEHEKVKKKNLNDSWDNMIIEADDESIKSINDIDQFFNKAECHYKQKDDAFFKEYEEYDDWKSVQILGEITSEQPFLEE